MFIQIILILLLSETFFNPQLFNLILMKKKVKKKLRIIILIDII